MTPVTLTGAVAAFFQVVRIDLTLAGDNAVAVGLAAAGLPPEQRRRAIVLGLGGAVVLLIGFALIAVQMLKVVGLLLAGGILLLWVCWKMWRELRDHARLQDDRGELALEDATGLAHADSDDHPAKALPATTTKTLGQALLQILLADVSMSLDNVLAVAGAARQHPYVLVFGLLLSIVLMGIAAAWIAKLLQRWRWLGYVGLVIVIYVALHMIWEGHRQVVIDLGHAGDYNAMVPNALGITPNEVAAHKGR